MTVFPSSLTGDAYGRVVSALEQHGSRRHGGNWQCPAHKDDQPSLSVSRGDSCVLVHCHAGCSVGEVCSSLELTLTDLFDEPPARSNGLGEPTAAYVYTDESNRKLFQVLRFEPKDFRQQSWTGTGWEWGLNGTRRVLYRLPNVLEAIEQSRTVYVVEGEKDVAALERAGEVATCNPGGAGKWRDDYSSSLKGANVLIVADRDETGREHARNVYAALRGTATTVRVCEPVHGKDVADHLAAGRGLDELVELPMDDEPTEPFALELDEFIAMEVEGAEPLVGDELETILPAFGLLLLYAKGGKGKTTLTIDLMLHLASGVEWLGFPVARPLNVLFIENEGPREPFRRKLKLKRELWPHEITGKIHIYTELWGGANLKDAGFASRLTAFVAQHEIDVIIGDPLDSLGLDGVGSPEDTREFLRLMGEVGLRRTVAFWLLHHSRKDGADDEMDEISGAWGGRPDTMLSLKKLAGERARLGFPKIRFSRRGTRAASILGFDPETEGFSVVGTETDEERDYVLEITELLSDGKWRTVKEIASKKEGGIGAGETPVREALAEMPERFESRTGEDAKAVGRHSNSTVWCLRQTLNAHDADTEKAEFGREE